MSQHSLNHIFGSIDNPRSYDLARATIRKWSDLGSSQNSDKGSPVFTTEVLAETSSTAADLISAETDFHCDKCRGEGSVNGLTCPRCGGKGVEPLI